jgi:hypothetical protein
MQIPDQKVQELEFLMNNLNKKVEFHMIDSNVLSGTLKEINASLSIINVSLLTTPTGKLFFNLGVIKEAQLRVDDLLFIRFLE